MPHRLVVSTVVLFGLVLGTARAQQPAAAELLQRVPDELGLCLVINDLRGQVERWEKTPWLPKLKSNPLVQSFLGGKEVRDILQFEDVLKKHLQIDFADLRNDILGDAVVFAYQPANGPGGVEKGLLLIKARTAEALTALIDKVNELQTNIGELTSLEDRKYKNHVYRRRVHQQATHFYFQKGPLLAISNREEVIQAMLDRGETAPSVRRDQWAKAGLSSAVATLVLDPRVFDAELTAQARTKTGTDAILYQSVLAMWKGLDGIFVSLQGNDAPEVRLTLIARPGSEPAKLWNAPQGPPSELWRHFPENALVSAAGPIDFAVILKKLREVIPDKEIAGLELVLKKNLAAATGLDLDRDLLPNIGPHFGFAVTLSDGPGLPRALVALAVKSAPAEAPVDQMLYKSALLFANLAVFEYNRKNNDPINVRTVKQGDIEVKYLANDKLFPPGVQPALALKDGYLLLASSPDAVAGFRANNSPAPSGNETPLIRMSMREWSRLIKAHREMLVDHLVKKNNEAPASAAGVVDGLAAGFDLFQSLTVSQRVGEGRAAWIIRLTPAKN